MRLVILRLHLWSCVPRTKRRIHLAQSRSIAHFPRLQTHLVSKQSLSLNPSAQRKPKIWSLLLLVYRAMLKLKLQWLAHRASWGVEGNIDLVVFLRIQVWYATYQLKYQPLLLERSVLHHVCQQQEEWNVLPLQRSHPRRHFCHFHHLR